MALTTVNPGLLDSQAQYTGFKNRLINGQMQIDQRNAGASVTVSANDSSTYINDRWQVIKNSSATISAQQTTTAPSGFSNSLCVTVSAGSAVGATNYLIFGQRIEGFNFSDLSWGTAAASNITISFQVRSSLTGTFSVVFVNSENSRCYGANYTISSANTWEAKTITIAGDTTGTWVGATNGIGLSMYFSLGAGSSYQGTAGSWQAMSNLLNTSTAQNTFLTSANTFYITGVQLEKGSVATSFDYRPYGTELALCQRYYEVYYQDTGGVWPTGTYYNATNYFSYWAFKVEKRAQATVTRIGGTWGGTTPTIYNGISSSSFYASGNFYMNATAGTKCLEAAAEL